MDQTNDMKELFDAIFENKDISDKLKKFGDGFNGWLSKNNSQLNLKIMYNGRYVGQSAEWLYKFIREHFVQRIHFTYEWFALYQFLSDYGYLKNPDMSKFANQMNIWYKDMSVPCSPSEIARYNFLSGIPVSKWSSFKKDDSMEKISNLAVARIYTDYANLSQKLDDCLR